MLITNSSLEDNENDDENSKENDTEYLTYTIQ